MAAENFYDQDRKNTGFLSKSTFKSILAVRAHCQPEMI